MTPEDLEQQVNEIFGESAGTLTEEADLLARAHAVLTAALNND